MMEIQNKNRILIPKQTLFAFFYRGNCCQGNVTTAKTSCEPKRPVFRAYSYDFTSAKISMPSFDPEHRR